MIKTFYIRGGKEILKIIYSCYWGSYLAVVAASLHLGIIDRKGHKNEDILALPLFNKIPDDEIGEMFLLGVDSQGREIYVIGAKNVGPILEKTFYGIAEIFNIGKHAVHFVDLSSFNNIFIHLGSLFIKKCNMEKLGMQLVLIGVKKSFKGLCDITLKLVNTD